VIAKNHMVLVGSQEKPTLITNEGEAVAPPPRLVLELDVFLRLECYFRSTDKEFQVLGFVEAHDNSFVVGDLVVPKHSSGAAYTEIDQNAFPALLDELEKAGKDIEKLRLQIHSHGDLPAYFSPEDVNTIRTAYACDWMISFVGNRACDWYARLDVFEPISLSIALPIFISLPAVTPGQEEEWMCELKSRMGRSFL